jgi:ribosomal protein S18 acetylase RimI-like enzyme
MKIEVFEARLGVMETNQRAINLYKKIGFEEIAKIPKQIPPNHTRF